MAIAFINALANFKLSERRRRRKRRRFISASYRSTWILILFKCFPIDALEHPNLPGLADTHLLFGIKEKFTLTPFPFDCFPRLSTDDPHLGQN
jgi:hypothetical protein